MCLDPTPLQVAGDLWRRLGDPDAALEQVEPTELERDQLAGPEPGVGGEPDQDRVRLLDRMGQDLDLDGGEEVHLLALDLGRLHSGSDVAGQAPTIDCAGQDLAEHLEGLAGSLGRETAADQPGQPLAARSWPARSWPLGSSTGSWPTSPWS